MWPSPTIDISPPAQCSPIGSYQSANHGGDLGVMIVDFRLPFCSPHPAPLTFQLSSPAFWQLPNYFSLFCPVPEVEAIHLGSLVAAQGYVFPISDHVLTMKDDGTFYRFQVGMQLVLLKKLFFSSSSDLRLELPKKLTVFKGATLTSHQHWDNQANFCLGHLLPYPHSSKNPSWRTYYSLCALHIISSFILKNKLWGD